MHILYNMDHSMVDYEMDLDFMRREIMRDLAEITRYREQMRVIADTLSHLPAELRPSPLRRTKYYLKAYKPIAMNM